MELFFGILLAFPEQCIRAHPEARARQSSTGSGQRRRSFHSLFARIILFWLALLQRTALRVNRHGLYHRDRLGRLGVYNGYGGGPARWCFVCLGHRFRPAIHSLLLRVAHGHTALQVTLPSQRFLCRPFFWSWATSDAAAQPTAPHARVTTVVRARPIVNATLQRRIRKREYAENVEGPGTRQYYLDHNIKFVL